MPDTRVLGRQKNSLHELSSDILVLILQLRQAKTLADPMHLRSRATDLFTRFERDAREAGLQADDITTARLALVAFLDEAVFGLEFSGKEQWQEQSLGMELLGINYAGVEFFTRLDECRRRGEEKHEVLELLYLCLILGYKGRYLNDPEGLRGVIGELKVLLFKSKGGRSSTVLSPRGKPEGELRTLVRSELPVWVVVVCAGALALLFYACMTWQIDDAADTVMSLLK